MREANGNVIGRRRFIRGTSLAMAGLAAVRTQTFSAGWTGGVSIVRDPDDVVAVAGPSRWAVGQLREALRVHGIDAQVYPSLEKAPADTLCIVVAGSTSRHAKVILQGQNVAAPSMPEALALVHGTVGERSVLLACGADTRGLGYAVLELADRLRHSDAPLDALDVPQPIVEEPANSVRSIYRPFTSEIEDKPWFYNRESWRQYLTMLATQRINRFCLAFGMGYNTPRNIRDSYLFFAYPFLVDVPGYNVRAIGLQDAERDRNLEMLKFISDETAARGIHFQLALWSHGAHWPNSEKVNYPLEGLTNENHAPYCRDALLAILKACPSISGTTFRVHSESGVPRGSDDFWRVLFDAHPLCGRKVEIDMHGKQVTQSQIDIALATGMPVVISPKYCGEHQGLGYHQAAIRSRELANEKFVEPASGVGLGSRRFTRYGYGDLMPEDRRWGILHRIWPGTQRLLLSGDPVVASAYGRFASFCSGLGVEVLDPLAFKGRRGSGNPGNRCAYLDTSLMPEYDWQKYLYWYRVWGRLTYNPDSDPDVWRRYLRHRFQKAAVPAGRALASGSRVLKLVTTAHGPSANCILYWPEMYTNMPIVDPRRNEPYTDTDTPKKFGNVSPFDPQLFSRIDEYADAFIDGRSLQKYSPPEVAKWLDGLAGSATANLAQAEARVADKGDSEYRRLAADVRIQIGIARFFAWKMRSAVLWRVFEQTGDVPALTEALAAYRTARKHWAQMAEDAKTVYMSDVSFGETDKLRGHWIDRLPDIDGDIEDMRKKLDETKASGTSTGDRRFIDQVIRETKSPRRRPSLDCRHTPVKEFAAGDAINLGLSIQQDGAREVTLYYRRLNQALTWEEQTMTLASGSYHGTIPADYTQTRYPLQYYFGIDSKDSGQTLYPGLDLDLKHMPYFVVRRKNRAV